MDQCTQGLNFDALRSRREILSDYKHVLEKIYDPLAYARRLQRLARLLGKSNPNRQVRANDSRSKLGGLEVVHRVVSKLSGAQDIFRQTIIQCASTNPQWARIIVLLTALYLHLGSVSRHVIRQIEQQLVGPNLKSAHVEATVAAYCDTGPLGNDRRVSRRVIKNSENKNASVSRPSKPQSEINLP